MKKILTVLLMLGLLVLLLSACADEQKETIPQQIDETIATELVQQEETENIAEDEAVPTPEPSPESVYDIETIEIPEITDNPQTITKMAAANEGITEELKAIDPMKWVGLMNSIRSAAEETILEELVYS